jgi:hypothetical protein
MVLEYFFSSLGFLSKYVLGYLGSYATKLAQPAISMADFNLLLKANLDLQELFIKLTDYPSERAAGTPDGVLSALRAPYSELVSQFLAAEIVYFEQLDLICKVRVDLFVLAAAAAGLVHEDNRALTPRIAIDSWDTIRW